MHMTSFVNDRFGTSGPDKQMKRILRQTDVCYDYYITELK